MTNRKWMLEQNEYDLLLRANDFMWVYSPRCALELFATETWYQSNGEPNCDHVCKACVQKWLNEERR